MVMRIFAILALAVSALAAGGGAFAKPAAPSAPASFETYAQIGFDTEMGSRHFMWLVPYFDLDHLDKSLRNAYQQHLLTEEILEDYVLQKEAFQALPPKLREKLAQGLDLENRGQVLRSAPAGLLDASGQAIGSERPKILRPEQSALPSSSTRSAILRPDSASAPNLQAPKLILPENVSSAPARSDWAVLNARWNALPLAEKQAAVKVKFLAPNKVAEVAMGLKVEARNAEALRGFLKLKTSAPAWLKQFDVTLDLTASGKSPIELSLKGPARDVPAAFETAQELFRATKTEHIRSAPHKQLRTDTAFHLHIGLQRNAPPELKEKMAPLLKSYRRLMLARLLQAGPQNDVIARPGSETRSRVAFDNGIGTRGLVRKISDDHVELRELTGHPKEVFAEFSALMDLDTPSAQARISREIRLIAEADPSVLPRIFELNPNAYLTEFSDVATAEELAAAAKKFAARPEAEKALRNLIHKHPDEQGYRVLRAVMQASDNPELLDSPYLYPLFQYNKKLAAEIQRDLLADPVRNLRGLNEVLRWENAPKDPRIVLLGKASSEAERIRLLEALDEGYGRENLLRYKPHHQAGKEQLALELKKIYGEEKSYGADFLLADDLFKNLEGRSPLKAANLDEILKASFWSEGTAGKLAFEQMATDLKSRYFNSLMRARMGGRLNQHLAELATYPAQNFTEAIADFERVAAKVGPLPEDFLSELRAARSAAAPEAAAKMENILNALASSVPAPAHAGTPASCAAGFARIGASATR